MDLRGKRALVMGLGIHGVGLGVARFLADQGALVTVTDLRGPEQLQSSIDALADLPITYVLGQHRDEDFGTADLVIRRSASADRKSTRLNSSHEWISYAVFC